MKSKTTTKCALKRLTIARINMTTAIVIIAQPGTKNQLEENYPPNKLLKAMISAKVLVKV